MKPCTLKFLEESLIKRLETFYRVPPFFESIFRGEYFKIQVIAEDINLEIRDLENYLINNKRISQMEYKEVQNRLSSDSCPSCTDGFTQTKDGSYPCLRCEGRGYKN